DLYLIPLQASQPLPEFIDLLDQVQIPKKRDENMLLGVFVLNKGKVVVPPTTAPVVPAARSVVDTGNSPVPVTSLPSQSPVQNDTLPSFVSSLGAANAPLPYGVNPSPPVPVMPGIPQIPSQVQGMPYSYHNQMMMPPPVATAIPPPSAPNLSALADSIKNMTPDQINLILKGLSMANSNPSASSSLPPASSWNPPQPPDSMYPYMDSHSNHGPPPRSPSQSSRPRDWDDRYPRDRDRERRSSPPYRGRPNRPRDRDERRDRGRNPRDRRGEYGSSDSGWARR
ncbi:1391_t:CDS:2, partial [Acaulospora colombiana]